MKKGIALTMLSLGMFVSAKAPSYSDSNSKYNNEKNYFNSLIKPEIKEEIGYSKVPEETFYINRNEVGKIIDSLYAQPKSPRFISAKEYLKFVNKESNFDLYAYNEKSGASGLAQIRKNTWDEVFPNLDFYKNRFDSRLNLEAGVKYISWLERAISKKYSNWSDLDVQEKKKLVIAGYNWGIGNLKNNGWDLQRSPKETKKYIDYILGSRNI